MKSTKLMIQQANLAHLIWYHLNNDTLLEVKNRNYLKKVKDFKDKQYEAKAKISHKIEGSSEFAYQIEKELLDITKKFNIILDYPPKFNTRTLGYVKSCYYAVLESDRHNKIEAKEDSDSIVNFIHSLKRVYSDLNIQDFEPQLAKSTLSRRKKDFNKLKKQIEEYPC